MSFYGLGSTRVFRAGFRRGFVGCSFVLTLTCFSDRGFTGLCRISIGLPRLFGLSTDSCYGGLQHLDKVGVWALQGLRRVFVRL